MAHSTFDRVAASGGIAFTVLAVATVTIAPPTPAVDAAAADIRRYLTDHHDRFGLSVITMALAVLAFALALGYVQQRLRDADQGTALPATVQLAGAVAVTFALGGVLLQGVLAQYGVDGTDDSTLLALNRAWNIVAFMGPPLPLAIVLLLAGVRTIQVGVFPRWIGWVGIVSGLGGLTTALMNLGTSVRAPFVLDTGSFLLSCVWATGIAVHALMARQPRSVAEPASA